MSSSASMAYAQSLLSGQVQNRDHDELDSFDSMSSSLLSAISVSKEKRPGFLTPDVFTGC